MSTMHRSVTPRIWCDLLDGRDLAPLPSADPCPVDVAMFRFPGLPERLALPPLDAHYISFTLAGALDIERDLGRDVERARFRPGMSLILPAGRENAWRWNGATDELHLYVSPSWLGEVGATIGVAAPAPGRAVRVRGSAAALARACAARRAACGRRRRAPVPTGPGRDDRPAAVARALHRAGRAPGARRSGAVAAAAGARRGRAAARSRPVAGGPGRGGRARLAPTSRARSASPRARRRTRTCASGASPGRATCWPARPGRWSRSPG